MATGLGGVWLRLYEQHAQAPGKGDPTPPAASTNLPATAASSCVPTPRKGSSPVSADDSSAHERGWLGKVRELQTSLAAEGASFAGAAPDVSESRMPNLTPTCDQHLWELTRCGSLMASG
jgi:hypothetical protein